MAVQPLCAGGGDPVLQVAKRMVKAHEPQYVHSSEVARRKRFNPRVLGRITGNVWFTVGGWAGGGGCMRGAGEAHPHGGGALGSGVGAAAAARQAGEGGPLSRAGAAARRRRAPTASTWACW